MNEKRERREAEKLIKPQIEKRVKAGCGRKSASFLPLFQRKEKRIERMNSGRQQ